MVPKPTYIYHITHLKNLKSILENDGLLSYSEMHKQNVDYTNIAHESIQNSRATTMVPCSPGGTLHDYVPFYFAPRSPMLYTIGRDNVEGYAEG